MSQAWLEQSERGTVLTIRLIVGIAFLLGRPVARACLYPICLYFLIFSVKARRASVDYLARVLGRKARLRDVFRHYMTFATVVLDRFFLVKDRHDLFETTVHGEQLLQRMLDQGRGCLLLGAHMGSFEILRALGTSKNLQVGVVMYEDNAKMVNTFARAINPALAECIIPLGRFDSMLKVRDRLQQSAWVGILADRTLDAESQVLVSFLGKETYFSTAPFRLAVMLKRPVVLMLGIFRGGNRYELYFEKLLDPEELERGKRTVAIEDAVRLYVERLEHRCKDAPYNWFNFYDFWARR